MQHEQPSAVGAADLTVPPIVSSPASLACGQTEHPSVAGAAALTVASHIEQSSFTGL